MKPILNVEQNRCWFGPTDQSVVIVDAEAYYSAFYRAACHAQSFIALAGWQFDTGAQLLRGEAAARAPYPVQLLPFLNALCRERPELRVYILAWDYSLVYSLEREWLQKLKFAFQSAPAIRFEFDAHPNIGGSHHQKLAVVDGVTAFAGGLDICDERWDDRRHAPSNQLRVNQAGAPCRPNHEVQAAVQGPAAAAVTAVFIERWQRALGETLELRPEPSSPAAQLRLAEIDRAAILPLRADTVALARTLPGETQADVKEVKSAISAALLAAERFIYVETQYFTSHSVTAVLLERLRDTTKPRLQILILMPRGADNSKEKFALGDLQAAVLSELEAAAEHYGHELRFLCSAASAGDCETATFIHSKVLIVDDELLCVGSANMTERSMALDSELCLLWQGEPGSPLASDIRAVRSSLLAEHSGREPAEFEDIEGLVQRLDGWLETKASRFRVCHFDPVSVNLLKRAIFDPEGPVQFG